MEKLAKLFAAKVHGDAGHKRKYSGEDYIVHPVAVAELVRSVPHSKAMVAAAYLHDVVEDSDVSLEAIKLLFGAEVADLVGMVTKVSKPSDGNRAARKAIDKAHYGKASPAGKTLKLADIISNSSNVADVAPEFAAVYIPEIRDLLGVLGDGDPVLYKRAMDIVGGYNGGN